MLIWLVFAKLIFFFFLIATVETIDSKVECFIYIIAIIISDCTFRGTVHDKHNVIKYNTRIYFFRSENVHSLAEKHIRNPHPLINLSKPTSQICMIDNNSI